MKEKIEAILKENFPGDEIQVRDDTRFHEGHTEAIKSGGGHYSIMVISNKFEGLNTLERHRKIYELLEEYMQAEIHALAIKVFTMNESKMV